MSYNCCCEKCVSRLYAEEIPIFESLSKEELDKIISVRNHMAIKKGEILFLEGDKVSKLFIISEGMIKISKSTASGKEQILNILTVGDFLGENNILGEVVESNISATAVKDTELCTISREDLKEILSSNITICLKFLSELNKRLIEVENLSKNLSNNNPESRICCMLLEFSEKYGKEGDGKIEIALPLNREGMANYCGIARETLSRKLSAFESKGIIKLIGNKKIVINDIDLLEEEM
ncbi:Crp/Fnr family transcriptional regulator [Clostridium paraputrificum]|uniref:Crp/Fnr family transcriptional regulator n=1 Tax=Clostridium TaxID=1485 RepID=UPI003D33A795